MSASQRWTPSGIASWVVIDSLIKHGNDVEKTVTGELRGAIRVQDVEAALDYYEQHKPEVDRQLAAVRKERTF